MRDFHRQLIQDNIEKLHRDLRIAVIFGGDKKKAGAVINATHNPRADKTYEHVADDIVQALRTLGFRSVIKLPEDMHLAEELVAHDINFCWVNSGGTQGAASITHAPALLELLGLPYVGHSPLNAGILDSKNVFKSLMQTIGIPTAAFTTFDPSPAQDVDADAIRARLDAVFGGFGGEYIVKPVSGRASLNVHHVASRLDVPAVVARVGEATGGAVMVESFLGGAEYTMACIGPMVWRDGVLLDRGAPFSFSGVERRLEADEKVFTSMDVRKISRERLRVLDPQGDAAVWTAMARITQRVFSELNLSAGIRVDFRADDAGQLHVLEANPKPDLKRPDGQQLSLVCAGLHQFDMDYESLVLSMLLNKLHTLVTYQPFMAPQIVEILKPERRAGEAAPPRPRFDTTAAPAVPPGKRESSAK